MLRILTELTPVELAALAERAAGHPIFRLYWAGARAALLAGSAANRLALLGRARQGLVLGVRFDRLRVYSVLGMLDGAELAALLDGGGPRELHITQAHYQVLAPHLGQHRLDTLRYYLRRGAPAGTPDPRVRRLGPADYELVSRFFRAHYPETIFSEWMLAQPFYGLFTQDELLAAGGTVVVDRELGAANLGNFLTRPSERGRGLARIVALALMTDLMAAGVTTFTLGTLAANVAACRTYEGLGFHLLEERLQVRLD